MKIIQIKSNFTKLVNSFRLTFRGSVDSKLMVYVHRYIKLTIDSLETQKFSGKSKFQLFI